MKSKKQNNIVSKENEKKVINTCFRILSILICKNYAIIYNRIHLDNEFLFALFSKNSTL